MDKNSSAKFSTGQLIFLKVTGEQGVIIERQYFTYPCEMWAYRLRDISGELLSSLYPINSEAWYPEKLLLSQPIVAAHGTTKDIPWVVYVFESPVKPMYFSFVLKVNGQLLFPSNSAVRFYGVNCHLQGLFVDAEEARVSGLQLIQLLEVF